DYELALLDLVADNGLKWKEIPNELFAFYATNGYDQINGAAAFLTTFEPRELSAYCSMGSRYAEFFPSLTLLDTLLLPLIMLI
ncbi:hypothetical protein K432DRAFT_293434, partial [Lepidopterella palustris CBS 459.81]